MKALITGIAGFIGSHLAESLLDKGYEVEGIDDFSEGKMSNVPHGVVVHTMDITYVHWDNFFRGVDVVFHLASLTRPEESRVEIERYNDVNVNGTLKVFKACKKHGVKRVVFASTSGAYGENVYPTPESAPFHPMCPYAFQKSVGEGYAKFFDLEINCIRPFNVYGPRQNPLSPYSAAVPKFIDALAKNRPAYITGDGEQRRDFIYVDDVVEEMILLSQCETYGESFNAGSGTNVSINELLTIICKLMGKEFNPDYVDKVLEPTQTLADMSKVKKVLNWQPKISLEEGLKRTIDGDK
jgi:UDP-glucose 4-epimerase